MDDRLVEGMIFAPLVHYLMIILLLILTVQQTPDEPSFLLMVTLFTALFFFNISGTFFMLPVLLVALHVLDSFY